MIEEQLREDISYLSGHLEHRGAHTDSEREAAEYLQERFGEYTALSDLDDFHSIESQNLLFASYYAEFLVVAVVASFWPWASLGYGAGVFVLYVAEFTGFRLLGRFMPQFDSQNVCARFMAEEPERLMIVTANYDSPRMSNIEDESVLRWIRPLHMALIWCMLLVLGTCATEAMEVFGEGMRPDLYVRWICVGVLLLGAYRVFTLEQRWEFVRGPINNASGVAVLLALGEKMRERPLEKTDVWLVATGSKSSWMAGMRQLLQKGGLDRKTTYFVNVAHVGAGQLRYVTKEGVMHAFASHPELIEAARAGARYYGVEPLVYRWLPTDALLPLARGYKAIGVVGSDEDGLPVYMTTPDIRTNVDYDELEKAVDYVESILRKLDSMPSPYDKP